jgi:hypothetical protein
VLFCVRGDVHKPNPSRRYDFQNLFVVKGRVGNTFLFAMRIGAFVGGNKNRKNVINTLVEGGEIARVLRNGTAVSERAETHVSEGESAESGGVEVEVVGEAVRARASEASARERSERKRRRLLARVVRTQARPARCLAPVVGALARSFRTC